jgi:hypothetical protein
MDLRTHIALVRHLISPVDDQATATRYTSGFLAALGDARASSGRDETGKVVDETQTGHWLGAVAWMVLLDQIGSCFRPTPATGTSAVTASGRAVVDTLHWWYAELPDLEVLALYALRCAFAHDYSLWNLSGDSTLQHCFVVDRDTARFVQLPSRPWTPADPPAPDNQTFISLRRLGDVCEEVVSRIRAAAASDTLEIILKGGVDELEHRYGITFSYKNPQ